MVRRWTRWYHWVVYFLVALSLVLGMAIGIGRCTYASEVRRDFVTICTVSGLPDRIYTQSRCRCFWRELRQEYSIPRMEYWTKGREWAQIPFDDLYDAAQVCLYH